MSSAVGTSWKVGTGRSQLDVRRAPVGLHEAAVHPEADRAGQLLARDDAAASADRPRPRTPPATMARATPWPAGGGEHPEAAQVDARRRRRRAAARRRARRRARATRPPPRARRVAIEASVSLRASAGGSSGGRLPKASRTMASTTAADSGPTRRTVSWSTGGRPGGRRGDELVELGVDLVVALERHHVARALALEQPRARGCASAACGSGRSR